MHGEGLTKGNLNALAHDVSKVDRRDVADRACVGGLRVLNQEVNDLDSRDRARPAAGFLLGRVQNLGCLVVSGEDKAANVVDQSAGQYGARLYLRDFGARSSNQEHPCSENQCISFHSLTSNVPALTDAGPTEARSRRSVQPVVSVASLVDG